MQNGASALERGAGSKEEKTREQGGSSPIQMAGYGDYDAGSCEGNGEREETGGGLVIAENACDDGEQEREEWRPVEIDVGVGAKGKIVLDGNEVSVESAELVERMGHGHAAGAGPTLEVAVKAEVEEAGVEGDEGEHRE